MEEVRPGQPTVERQRFCPYPAVAKYPYRYFHGSDDDRKCVGKGFWDRGQFKDHGWNIYYVQPLFETNSKPFLLIPKSEVETFFQEIKDKTGIHLPFPDETKDPGFDVAFQVDGEPQPRYLARLTSETTITELQDLIPPEGMAPEESSGLDRESLLAFRKRMGLAYLAGRNDAQAQKDRRKKDRLLHKGRCCTLLRRTQRYLGVRPPESPRRAFQTDVAPPLLNVTQAVPYQFNLNVVFICIDIEAYERDSKKITEIGISTLDTLDIIDCSPEERGTGWAKHMRSRHFRVADYGHLVNGSFVQGCPDNFRPAFGVSEWISVNEISQVVAACFQEPFSSQGQYTPHPTRRLDCPRYGSNIQPLVNTEQSLRRNVILVGHEIKSDIGYLRSVGCDIASIGNVLEAVDTNDLWRAWKHDSKAQKLARILYELEIDAEYLHNAGNDAAYTLQALIGITVGSLDPSKIGTKHVPVDPSDEAAENESTPDEKARHIEEEAEWADIEQECADDGGNPVSVSDLEFDLSMGKNKRSREKGSKGPSNSQAGPSSHSRGQPNPIQFGSAPRRQSRPQDTKPKNKPAGLSQQMEKRLVIFDDEDYGA